MAATADAGPTRRIGWSTYFFGALGGLLLGYDLGIVAGALLFITPELGLSNLEAGMITSSLLVGGMVGALGCGRVTDHIGRRAAVLLAAVLFGVGAIGAALAPGVVTIIVFRFVMGLAVGMTSVTVPVYLSEIAPAQNRGALSGLNQLMISIGILVAYLVNLGLSPFEAWRWMFGLGVVPALLLLLGAYFQPESPRWLVKKGRFTEAREVLARSRPAEQCEAELSEIVRVNEHEQSDVGFRQVLSSKRLRSILYVGIGLAFLQQIIGINTIIYYAPTILKNLGFTDSAAIIANAGLGALTVVVTVLMLLFVVDRIGRRRPLIFGSVAMGAAMLVLGIIFLSGTFNIGGAAGWVAIACLAFFKIAYSLSWGGLVWIMLGEIFPLRARGTAMGMATFTNWGGNFLVGLLFPVLLGAGTGIVFFIFAGLCLVTLVFAVTKVPETKQRSLEQIEHAMHLSRTAPDGKRDKQEERA